MRREGEEMEGEEVGLDLDEMGIRGEAWEVEMANVHGLVIRLERMRCGKARRRLEFIT